MQIRITKLLISLLELKFVLTPKSHISLYWKFQCLPSYTPRFAHVTLQFLGFGKDNGIEWQMLFISTMFSTILVLMTTSSHKTTSTQFGKH
jgi:hypothetical protein